MPESFRVASPDFNLILQGDNRAIGVAFREIWLGVNEALTRIERRRMHWEDVPFAAGEFTASAGTWTVASADVLLYRYVWVDNFLLAMFTLENTTTSSGMGTDLYIDLPRHVSAATPYDTGFLVTAGNITEVGQIATRSGSNDTSLVLTRTAGSSWPSAVTDDLDVRGMIVVQS